MSRRRPLWLSVLAGAAVFLMTAAAPSLLFAASEPTAPWTLPEQASTYAARMDGLFNLILWITGIVFLMVEITLLAFVFKYRARNGGRATYTHGSNRLEVIWTIIPALILVFLAVMSQDSWAYIRNRFPATGTVIDITAEQFAWNIRYPGPDGKLNTADDIVTLNQLHFPVDKPALISLHSKDVIHSFFLPEFRIKQDAVPGMTTRVWVQAKHTGHWEIACAELCGLGHYRMKGYLTVDTPEDFQKWLAQTAAENSTESK
jgi:cytochrome c oxidase subunit 2